jgi:hypothetical protein
VQVGELHGARPDEVAAGVGAVPAVLTFGDGQLRRCRSQKLDAALA